MNPVLHAILEFERKIMRKELYSSYQLAIEALSIMKLCVEQSASNDRIEIDILNVTKRLKKSVPFDVVINNLTLKIVEAINEEMDKTLTVSNRAFDDGDVRKSQSMSFLELFSQQPLILRSNSSQEADFTMKTTIKNIINEYMEEVESVYDRIGKNGPDYVHDGDIILTLGRSKSILAFLSKAKDARRKFSVVIPERAPFYDGFEMAEALREKGIKVIVIPDTAIFAVMPRITTAIIPARAVLADGCVIAASLASQVSLAARHHSVPLIVVYWKWKLTERFRRPRDSFTAMTDPATIVAKSDPIADSTTVLSTDGEIVGGQAVKIYVNEDGAHGLAEVYPLVQSYYHQNE